MTDTKTRILDVAQKLFAEHGFDATSLRAITKEAGVNLEWTNFRFVAGGPQMPDYAVTYWQDMMGKMVKTTIWQENMAKYRWSDNFVVQDLGKYMDEKGATIDKVAAELGLKQ